MRRNRGVGLDVTNHVALIRAISQDCFAEERAWARFGGWRTVGYWRPGISAYEWSSINGSRT